MQFFRRCHSWIAAAFLCALPAAAAAPGLPAPAGHQVNFKREIEPIFERSCVSCHGPERQRGDLRLDIPELALQGGSSGPAIIPGKGAESLLVQFVAGIPEEMIMPEKGERLTESEIGLLMAWINQGANWPREAEYVNPAESHWAFQPLNRPVLPEPPRPEEILQPIDAFIFSRLHQEGLAKSPMADRTSLIRRLYFVMLGVPPAPEEVSAFLADSRPDAFERLVDAVLEDPRYGERWGRHWLDLVRFAETNGFETNRERLNAWRFRDYVIAAFNDDKPFNQFIREQIAGDLLGADEATGFLVAGPVDIVGSPDPVLTAQQRADELDDMVGATGTTFLGLTVSCARCHSHKFDPISHREYYAMAAVFAGVRHGDRPLAAPPEQEKERAARLMDARAELDRLALERIDLEPLATPGSGGKGEITPARSPVQARLNAERLHPVEARRLRFFIEGSDGNSKPGLDEIEVYADGRNIALASAGTTVSVSSTLPGYAIHQPEHLNDGRHGNDHSWISNEDGGGWVQLDFPETFLIDKVVWGRDRKGQFGDRVPVKYRVEVATANGPWQTVASSADRLPFRSGNAPAAFAHLDPAQADRAREIEARREILSLEIKRLDDQPLAYSGNFREPQPIHRLHRGDPMEKRELVPPGTLAIFNPLEMSPEEPESQRRLRLADWLASPENPLTARVLVNRLWQHHFGVGLVSTPNDFGLNGVPPSHPELLDWLASEFISSGWSIKQMQRRILLSATWRQSSAPRSEALLVDAGGALLWRFPPRRLEAEAIRDTVLAVSGLLNSEAGGPGFYLHDVDRENVYHYFPREKFTAAEHRRMVYAFKVRMEQDAIFGSFDCPDGSLAVARRGVSTTPLQALNLFNSPFIMDVSSAFAERLEREAGPGSGERIQHAWRLAFHRAPAPAEEAEAADFIRRHGLVALCRSLLNASETIFIP